MAAPDKTDALSKFLAENEASLLSGDIAVFDDLASVLYPAMKGYFIKKFKFEARIALSLANEVAVKIWMIIGRPEGKLDSLTPGYIYATAYSVGIDYIRQRKPHEQQIPKGFEPVSEQNPESSLFRSADVNEGPLNPQQLRCLQALYSIKKDYQVILRMKYGEEEKSIEEIAVALNTKDSNVRLLLWRARKAANKKLAEDKGP